MNFTGNLWNLLWFVIAILVIVWLLRVLGVLA